MAKLSTLTVILAAASIAPSLGFTPVSPIASKPSTTLHMSKSNNDVVKTIGSSMVAASLMLSTFLTPDAALAVSTPTDAFDFGPTSSLIAGRSGGRAGGRSSASTMRAPPRSSTTINRTTVINSAPRPATSVIVAPPPVVIGSPMGYGYSPFAPSPLGLGLGIAGEVGREMREYSQENQIREGRAREFALEQRLAQLEAQQNAQNAANAAAAAAAVAR